MLKGIPVSEGIAKGIAVCIKSEDKSENKQCIYKKAEDKDQESRRFNTSLQSFLEDTQESVNKLKKTRNGKGIGNTEEPYGDSKGSFCDIKDK